MSSSVDPREGPAPERPRPSFGPLVLLVTTLLCLAAVEVGVRLGWDNLPDGIYPRDTGCCAGGTLLPNVSGHDRFHAFRHNSRGYRGPEYTAGDVPHTRVALVGDSFVYGIGVSAEEAIAGVLQDRLAERVPGVEVINAGVPGGNLETGLARVEAVARDYRPDVVLFVLLYNDLEAPNARAGAPPIEASRVTTERSSSWLGRVGDWMVPPMDPALGRSQVVSKAVERRYALARAWRTWLYAGLELQRVGTTYTPVARELSLLHLESRQVEEVAWARTRAGLERFRALAEREGFAAGVVVFQTGPLEGVPALKLHALARESGLPVLDLDPLWGGYDAFIREWSFRFDLHPNRAANRVAAEAIDGFLAGNGWIPDTEGARAWRAAHAEREEAWLAGQRALADTQRARLAEIQAGFGDTLVGGVLPSETMDRQADQWLYGWWPPMRDDARGTRMAERGGFFLRAGATGATALRVYAERLDGDGLAPLSLSAVCGGQPLGAPVRPVEHTFSVAFALPAPVAAGELVECELRASGVVATPPAAAGSPPQAPTSFRVHRIALE